MLSEQEIKAYTERMKKAAENHDTEMSHEEMDEVLMDIAIACGCKKAVDIFNKAKKYYG